PAVFDRLVSDNLNRRQLDPLGQARCYQKLKENASALPGKGRSADAGIDLRDRLARRFNISVRNLDQWVGELAVTSVVPCVMTECSSHGQGDASREGQASVGAGCVTGCSSNIPEILTWPSITGVSPDLYRERRSAVTSRPSPTSRGRTRCPGVAVRWGSAGR